MIWFVLIVSMVIGLLPNSVFKNMNLHLNYIDTLNYRVQYVNGDEGIYNNRFYISGKDYAIEKNNDVKIENALYAIWFFGMIFNIGILITAQIKLSKLSRSYSAPDKYILELFKKCKERLHINKEIMIRKSYVINSPMIYGGCNTYVVIPDMLKFSEKDMEYVILHELMHYCHRDIVINYLLCILETIYWFNPAIRFGFEKLRLDREIYCDNGVLNIYDGIDKKEYGYAILNCTREKKQGYVMVSSMSGVKKHIKTRIEKISEFNKETKFKTFRSITAIAVSLAIALLQLPVISVFAVNDKVYTLPKELKIADKDLSGYFEGFEGSMVLYAENTEQYTIYNRNKSIMRVSPDSTYKILGGLNALEQGVISTVSNEMAWNGVKYQFEEWNRNQNLVSAMKNSVNWYFQELDTEIGMVEIERFLRDIGYGNCNINGGITDYWLESSLKISPMEQVMVLKNIFGNRYGWDIKNIDAVKDSIKVSEWNDGVLYGKTGTGNINGNFVRGWFVGMVENEVGQYYFATYIEGEDNAKGSTAMEITHKVLKDMDLTK